MVTSAECMDEEDLTRDRPTRMLRVTLSKSANASVLPPASLDPSSSACRTWSAVVRRTTQPMILACHSERRHRQDNAFLTFRRRFVFVNSAKRMFEKSWQIKTHGTRTRVRPSCLEAGMGNKVGEI